MLTHKRILLAEDDPNDVDLTLHALEKHRIAHEVHVVRDGAEALDYIFRRGAYSGKQTPHPAVIVLDIKMPKVDGLEVLRQIKADPELRVLPVVILTTSREERDLVEGYELGVNAFVIKPSNLQQFRQSVDELGCFWTMINEPPPGSRRAG